MYDLTKEILNITEYGGVKTKPNDKRISGSQFNAPTLQKYLKITHGFIEDAKIGANTIGSLMHVGLEGLSTIDSNRFESEVSFEEEYDDFTLSCTIDLIDHEKKVISDFKLTKRYTYEKFDQNSDYAWQLRFNKYLASKSDPKYENYDLYVIMFLKDFEASFKSDEISPVQYIKVDPFTDFDIIDKLDTEIALLNHHMEKDTVPEQCSDLWWRHNKKLGKKEPMRCIKYCSYNKVCPHYKPDGRATTKVMQW